MARHADIDVHPGRVVTRLEGIDAETVVADWRRVFAQDPAPGMSHYLWHVFSYGNYPSVALAEAQAEYEACVSPEYVVLSNEGKQAIITDLKPTSCSCSDYYVFPRNFAWTMAITHEDGWLGPYFAKHSDFAKLNEANLRTLRKAQEAAEAKRRGYW